MGNGTGTSVVKLRLEAALVPKEYVPVRKLVEVSGKLKLDVVPPRVKTGKLKDTELVPAKDSNSARVKNLPASAVNLKSKLPDWMKFDAIENVSGVPGTEKVPGTKLAPEAVAVVESTKSSIVPRLHGFETNEPRVLAAHAAAWAEEMPKEKELAVARAAPARSPLGEKTVIRLKGMC